MTILNIDEFQKLKVTDRNAWRKYCYDICAMCDWKVGKIKIYSDLYEYYSGPRSILIVGLNYAKEVLQEEVHIKNNVKQPIYKNAIEKLRFANTEEEIKKIIEDLIKQGGNLPKFIIRIRETVRNPEEKEFLLSKVKPIRNKELAKNKKVYLERQRENQLNKDMEYFRLFDNAINDDNITSKEVREMIGSYSKYYQLLSLYKEKQPEQYIRYIETTTNNKENISNVLERILKEIISKLLDNTRERKYDQVDYYLEYNKYTPLIKKYIPKSSLSAKERKLLYAFLKDGEKIGKQEKKSIINGIDTINVEKDEKGRIIPNSGVIIPMEEKAYWFSFLEENDIPVTTKTINGMKNRYKESLNKEKENYKVRKLTK